MKFEGRHIVDPIITSMHNACHEFHRDGITIWTNIL